MMRSLRGQLGVAIAIGAFVLTLAAALLVGFERWQEESNSLPAAVELDAFRLSEVEALADFDPTFQGGTDGFAVLFDAEAQPIAIVGDPDELAMDVAVSVWNETAEDDVIFSVRDDTADGQDLLVSGVACVDRDICDSAVVGRSPETLVGFMSTRLLWLIGPALFVAALAYVVARWMVGRALRPVEAMRAEAAVITASELGRRVPQPTTGDELEHLATTLNHTLARLQTSSEATERFAADAAHELRSPITGVRAAVELRAADDELLSDALAELDRASRLIDDLLVLAQRRGGQRQRTEVDLDDIVRRDVGAAQSRFPNVSFETTIEPARMSGDADGLRRVVANLIENAAEYCKTQVSVQLQPVAQGWQLQVDDDGPGIPPDERDRVFERFARLDESRARETGGSGLGLALVSELVADHEGSVVIGESPLGGARFEVTLPNGDEAGSER